MLGRTVAHGSGADANGDGIVDGADYSLWKASFGATFGIGAGAGATSGDQPVPEPTSWTLAAAALLSCSHLMARRRWRGHSGSKSKTYGVPRRTQGRRPSFSQSVEQVGAVPSSDVVVASIVFCCAPRHFGPRINAASWAENDHNMQPATRSFLWLGVVVLPAWLAAGDAEGVEFTDATSAAGVLYPLPVPIPPFTGSPISQTGGAAAGDFDNDGWPDLFITRHWDAPILYHNNQNGTFSDVTASAFTDGLPGPKSTAGSWGDIDNDGDLDLYVPTVYNASGAYLYVNDGTGHFTEQAAARNANLGGASIVSTSASFGDYDNDGYLDMYVGEWRAPASPTPPQARLLHNRGAEQPGYFEDVTATSGAAMGPVSGQSSYTSQSYTPRFVDFDRDGHADILVASDTGSSRLFWNNGNGTFSDGTPAIADNLGFNDMGLAIGDIDGNGLLDFFTSDICNPSNCSTTGGNRLFRNFGNRLFLESSLVSGVRDAGWGWGTEMFDYDNDKDLDIVATNGFYFSAAQQTDQVRLWANNGQGGVLTNFTDVAGSVGMTDTSQGRGLLTFDYDRDGDLDVFIVNNFAAPVLYRNDGGNQGDWLRIETVGTMSNADGVGAFITVTPDLAFPNKKLVHEISESSSFLSQSEPIAHFGLGASAEPVDLIRIEWPASGIVQELRNVAPNQLLSIVERHPSDFNGDGQIDAGDYVVWRQMLGQTVAHGSGADANGDGIVDGDDYSLWKAHFGVSFGIGAGGGSAAGHSVPEPTSSALAAVALLCWTGFMSRRSRRCHTQFPIVKTTLNCLI